MRVLFAVIAALLLLPSAASAQYKAEWEDMPVYEAAGWNESVPLALDYYEGVTGTITDAQGTRPAAPKAIADACPNGVSFRRLTTDAGANAWARSSGSGHDDCKVWIEQRFIDSTEALPPGLKERVRCAAMVHEVGHMLGLPHEFDGDALHILRPWPQQLYPQQCIDRWPVAAYDSGTGFAQEQRRQVQAAVARYTDTLDAIHVEVIAKADAKAKARSRLGEGWKIRATVGESFTDGATMVTQVIMVEIVATKQKCKRCKKQKRRYEARSKDGRLHLVRSPW